MRSLNIVQIVSRFSRIRPLSQETHGKSYVSSPTPFLCTIPEPCIQYLHTIKPLVQTINLLQSAQPYLFIKQQEIDLELNYLRQQAENYLSKVEKYVADGGYLTANAAVNVYCWGKKLGGGVDNSIREEAFKTIENKKEYLSQEDIKDLSETLKEQGRQFTFNVQINDQMQVKLAPNQTGVYEECQNSAKTHNLLLGFLTQQRMLTKIQYLTRRIIKKFRRDLSYELH